MEEVSAIRQLLEHAQKMPDEVHLTGEEIFVRVLEYVKGLYKGEFAF